MGNGYNTEEVYLGLNQVSVCLVQEVMTPVLSGFWLSYYSSLGGTG